MIRYVPIPSDSFVFINGDGSGRPGFSFWDTVTEGYVMIDNAMAWDIGINPMEWY